MKPKSFKSKEGRKYDPGYSVSPKQKYFQQLNPVHFCFGVDQLRIDSNEQIKIQWSLLFDAKDPAFRAFGYEGFAIDDVLTLAIGDSPKIVMATVADFKPMGDLGQPMGDLGQVTLTEHTQEFLRSSKQTPSAQMEKFLERIEEEMW